jgi:hypothetical protein
MRGQVGVINTVQLERLPDCEIVAVPARHWIPTEESEAMRAAIEDWLRRSFPGGV